jgi:chemotaxis protein methyltransferase CheR
MTNNEEMNNVISENDVKLITEYIKRSFGFDFTGYATGSLSRRIARYMEVKKIERINQLIPALKDKASFTEFLNEVTVNTTELFRDPSMWIFLRDKILPRLFEKNERVKIWHAACSSGEEVISMCILLKELNLLHKADIVGSDINTEILKQAQEASYLSWRAPHYLKNLEVVFPGKKVEDYFSKADNKLTFKLPEHKNVHFKHFDLVMDTSFSHFNLILCRNVLIYFEQDQQENIIKKLADSLENKGYLVLGAQESIDWHKSSDEFMSISNDNKIYRKFKGH